MTRITALMLLAMGGFGLGASAAQPVTEARLLDAGLAPDGGTTSHRPAIAPFSAAPSAPVGKSAHGNPAAAMPLDTLSATRERPIFSQSRRPPQAAPPPVVVEAAALPVEVTPPAPEHPPLTLVGTVVGAAQNVALFMKSNERAVVRLRIGETESGWTLRSVEPKSTTLEKNTQKVTLALPPPSSSGFETVPTNYGAPTQMSDLMGDNPPEMKPQGFRPGTY